MNDYSTVTELPGVLFPKHAFSMLKARYDFCVKHSDGKDVLELACGAGVGLGYIAQNAKSITGIDIDDKILDYPRSHYKKRANIAVKQGAASAIQYADASFDVIIINEAIYYFPDFEKVIGECRRVLRPEGTLLIVTVNPEWHGFNPSPFSTKYYSASELEDVLSANGFKVNINVSYYDENSGISKKLKLFIKQIAVTLKLIPKTMKGKVLLKRLLFGKLAPYPSELIEKGEKTEELVKVNPSTPVDKYIQIYAAAKVI